MRVARSVKFLEFFGDASYSTYLVHGLALTMLLRIWVMVESPSGWFVPAGLAVATFAGLGVHIVVERPILRIATSLWRYSTGTKIGKIYGQTPENASASTGGVGRSSAIGVVSRVFRTFGLS